MTDVFNNETVLVSFKTKRRLRLEKHNKTSGLEPDVYTIYLTDKTFFAEYSRKSLHGGLPKKVTKLDIPLTDIKKIEFRIKDGQECLYVLTDWSKEYDFEIGDAAAKAAAEEIIAYINK